MRVMVFVKATDESEQGTLPTIELLEAMGRYNDELVKAGVMLAAVNPIKSVTARKLARLAQACAAVNANGACSPRRVRVL